jgi:hypothetical protein
VVSPHVARARVSSVNLRVRLESSPPCAYAGITVTRSDGAPIGLLCQTNVQRRTRKNKKKKGRQATGSIRRLLQYPRELLLVVGLTAAAPSVSTQ